MLKTRRVSDSLAKDYHASILVLMETGLMIGRLVNPAPTYILVTRADYAEYFRLLGCASSFLAPTYMPLMRQKQNHEVQRL
jgi:hypothetical protein